MVNKETSLQVPSNWHWSITQQQIEYIKQGNRDVINKIYIDNYDKFCKIFRNFCFKGCNKSFYDDCVQQCYLDLPLYDYTNRETLFYSLFNTYCKVCYGGSKHIARKNLVYYDALLSDDSDETFLNKISEQVPSIFVDEAEAIEEDKRVLAIIQSQPQLTDLQRDYLVAVAYSLKMRRGLYADLQSTVAV